MARITSGGPGGAPIRMTDVDIQELSLDELRERLDFIRGKRSMVPGSSKQGSRTTTVAKKKATEVEEESI